MALETTVLLEMPICTRPISSVCLKNVVIVYDSDVFVKMEKWRNLISLTVLQLKEGHTILFIYLFFCLTRIRFTAKLMPVWVYVEMIFSKEFAVCICFSEKR